MQNQQTTSHAIVIDSSVNVVEDMCDLGIPGQTLTIIQYVVVVENLNLEKEIWKDIPEYEGLYQASNLGRVKSLERFRKGKNDSLASVKEKILKPSINHRGYYQVALCKNSIRKFYYVHRLVYEAFNGSIPEGLQVNHINEVKTDNRLSNLNLMTPKENINYGSRTEKCSKELKNRKDQSKSVLQFTLEDILIKEYPSIQQVYRETGFNQSNICGCCNGKRKQAYGYIWRYKE